MLNATRRGGISKENNGRWRATITNEKLKIVERTVTPIRGCTSEKGIQDKKGKC
jgi:hypothetical protein